MTSLNIQSDRTQRLQQRNQKKTVSQQKTDRVVRLARRNEMRSDISEEVSSEISYVTQKKVASSSNSRYPSRSTRNSVFFFLISRLIIGFIFYFFFSFCFISFLFCKFCIFFR